MSSEKGMTGGRTDCARWARGLFPCLKRLSARNKIAGARGEGGFAMLFVIFAIMVIGILGALVLLYSAVALRNAVGITPASRAFSAAEAGLEVAHAMLASEAIEDTITTPVTGSLWDGAGTYEVYVQKNPDFGDGDPYDWRIISYGEYRASVEGVERTFYRAIEEVVTFAGGRYYNAFDYVLFSKEGNININLDGDFSALSIGQCEIDGQVYAGKDIVLVDSAQLMGANDFAINGNVVTERGDVLVHNRSIAFAASDIHINGNIYSGILTKPGDIGGGVNLETDKGIISGGSINVTGDVNAHGRLRGYDYGVRIYNRIRVGASSDLRVSGNIRSNYSVFLENRALAFAWPTVSVNGNIFSGRDVIVVGDITVGADVRYNINGSIYAARDVSITGDSNVLTALYARVGGDIQAKGNVNIGLQYGVGALNPSGYNVAGHIYGRNVNLSARLGAGGTVANTVGGNIYCDGGAFNLLNRSGSFGTCTTTISGSVYGESTVNVRSEESGVFNSAKIYIAGGNVPAPAGLPGRGVFSNGLFTLSTSGNNASIMDHADARRFGGSPSISGNVTVKGSTNPLPNTFSVPQASVPFEPTPFNEVLMPQCDFDYYREKAKEQELEDGQQHYFPSSVPDLDIDPGQITSSLYVVFVEGDLGIGTVNVPVNCKGVFVATGNVILREELRRHGAGDAEFQIIAGNKVTYETNFNMAIDDNDKMFVYAAHRTYDPNTDPVSVKYEMGWFRSIEGQITARGDIVINSNKSRFKIGLYNHAIRFKNPAVLGEAFRIPFTVKSWKEI